MTEKLCLPMLVEKPVALDLGVASRILKGVERQGLITATGYQNRHSAHVQKAKELLQDQTVGMAVVMRFGRTPGKDWYRIQERSGGQLIEMATHQADMLRYLLGEVDTVYAAAATRINSKAQPDYTIFDVNCMTMTFQSGAVCNFANNFIAQFGTPEAARGLHIFTDSMTLSIDRDLTVRSAAGVDVVERSPNPLALEDEAFVRSVAENRRDLILSDYCNGVRSLAVTLAGDRSARTGEPVAVEELIETYAPNAGVA